MRRRRAGILCVFLVLAFLATAVAVVAIWRELGVPADLAPDRPPAASVAVLAGDGILGIRNGDAARARFMDPFGIAVAVDGTIYISDGGGSNLIRRITPAGHVSTVAGGQRGFADGAGTEARFDTPSALAIDAAGHLYVADTGNNAIRRVTPDGVVSTVAGTGVAGYRDGPAARAQFNGPIGVAVDRAGRIVVADTYNDRIRAIDSDGTVSTLAGSGHPGLADGRGAEARFASPGGVAVDAAGTVHVADTGNSQIRTIDAAGFVLTTPIAGAPLYQPVGIAVGPAGEVYVTDERGRIVRLETNGSASTVAGSTPGFEDGAGRTARFRSPTGVAVTDGDRLVVADAGNALIRLVAVPSGLELRPPPPPRIRPAFDAEGFRHEPLLWPVAPFDGPHEVAGTLGEARGSEGADRLHSGIDVRADQGTLVHAVREGIVTGPISAGEFGSLNEWIRIGAVSYVHLRVGRNLANRLLDESRFVPSYDRGRLNGVRVKRGARFATGEPIGSVNAFNHVHLNVGWPGEEHNPLDFRLVQFHDSVPPRIAPGGVRLYDERWQPLAERIRGRIAVSGRVQIVVDAWDQADGNRPGRRLGLYDLGYQVLQDDGSPAAGFETARRTQRFDRLALEPQAPGLVYAPGSGIPFYRGGRTRFLYVVTNVLRNGVAHLDFWDTTKLPAGDYTVRAWVADAHGNVGMANRDLPITITSSHEAPAGSPTAEARPGEAGLR
jgi:sugar lactone lactonase YvrE